ASPFLHDLPYNVHALGSSQKRWYVPAFAQFLRNNRHRFDGVIVHGLWEFTGLAALLSLGDTPYAVFPHGMLDPWFKRAYPAKHAKKWLYWLLAEYWVLRHAHRVLFTTQTESTLATQSFWLHNWTPAITPIGCEPPPADTARLIEAFHQRCPDLRDKRFLLYLGRIDPKKGADLLLDAFALTAKASPGLDLHLVIAGPETNPWATDLRASKSALTNSNYIHWPGMILGDAKLGALAAAEAFVLPSHQENFGVAVVEALSAGTPVLISNQVNLAPEVAADNCGYVEPDTVEGTATLLTRWMKTTQADRAAMSTQARLTFATRYDMRRNAEAILRIFEPHLKQATTTSLRDSEIQEAR
ncbi:MAG: glycosyltransferase, partial [Acidobacteriota bacterium]